MTPYRDRREAGHYDDPNAPKKTAAEKSTTSSDLGGLTGKTDDQPKTATKTVKTAKRGL